MIIWEQISRWDPKPVGAAADQVVTARNNLVGCQSAVDAAEVKDWHGDAADRSRRALARHREDLELLAARLGALAERLDVTESDLRALRDGIAETDAMAARHGFRIEGREVLDAQGRAQGDGVLRELTKEMITSQVTALLVAAEDVDQDLYAVLHGIRAITGQDAGTLSDAADSGRKQVELAEILEDYQTAEEGQVWFRVPDLSLTDLPGFHEQLVTDTEARMLDDLKPWELKAMAGIRESSGAVAHERYPDLAAGENEVRDRSHANAFKHAYWNALMVRQFGPEWTEEYATAHEAIPGNQANNEAMDLYNNEVGRRIATENPDASPAELADLIQQAERDGELVVLDEGGRLRHTDGVEHGQTDEPKGPTRVDPYPGRETYDPW
ncbi:hypothetical protein SAMN04488074_107336 [Lentzea albidocapillata subsp. violacea]|uniref:DUF6973 domain-containing protein n=1 Tax=Lentzea albidocapillata subsp. violacea TaxID=128104 RepID=A0A1G9FFB2_9PSEU|nr:hypothetical protein [Lentzea albidocapillata]SDK86873.1 hypothetical protein SAMN04488074_107336 [Lentzea albidocapillata subsp. violacea]